MRDHFDRLADVDPHIPPTSAQSSAGIDRFADLVGITEGGCLEWIGTVQRNGYGRFWFDGRNVLAHRWSYEHFVGPIPEGLHIDHLCRNRACVNPDHLEPVTPGENARRGTSAQSTRERAALVTHCPQGHPYDDANTYTQGSSRTCVTCKRAASRAGYERNRQAVIDRSAKWARDNPDRARESSRVRARRYQAKKGRA